MRGFSRFAAIAGAGVCAAIIAGTGAPRAFAGQCYDNIGCTDRNPFRLRDLTNGPSCNFLFVMRNRIYKDGGYCFHTPRAISVLGNQGCYTSDMGSVAMTPVERNNAATILQAEHALGCPP